jgi:SigmaW regulon antibacterial
VLEAVQVSVNPKVIQTPRVVAVAKDGIQVVTVARVTVRANIERLVGGAGEETIIARVGEGTVSSIGSAESHKYVLENPDRIAWNAGQKSPRGSPLRSRHRPSLTRSGKRRSGARPYPLWHPRCACYAESYCLPRATCLATCALPFAALPSP